LSAGEVPIWDEGEYGADDEPENNSKKERSSLSFTDQNSGEFVLVRTVNRDIGY